MTMSTSNSGSLIPTTMLGAHPGKAKTPVALPRTQGAVKGKTRY